MSDRPERAPRPLAKAQPAQGPFGALLTAAGADPEAAQGLALAYAALRADERARLLDAVVLDARREGVSAGRVLAALLAAESDPSLARRIAAELCATGAGALAPAGTPQAYLGGDAVQGGAILIRPLYGDFSEVLVLRWEEARGLVQADHIPLVRTDRAHGEACRLPLELRLAEAEVGVALAATRAAAEAHRALHGTLPRALERFEDWLGSSTACGRG